MAMDEWNCQSEIHTAANNTVDMETKPSEMIFFYFKNDSNHGVVASYLELYEKDEVEHINTLEYVPPTPTL